MIKFFRKIRQNLLMENKTGKYFKYAIGEIVLVVIGILIALQINNWNQQRIEQDKEYVYLTNIKRDLQHQLVSIELQLEHEQKYLDKVQPFLDYFYKHSIVKLDSTISRDLSIATERKTFVRTDPTYTDLISSGNIDIIKNTEFKNKLIEYYQNVELIEKINNNNNIHLNDQIYFSDILKLIYFNNGKMPQSTELVKISNKILQKEENKLRLINLVNFRKDLAKGSTLLMNEIKVETQELLDLMNKKG
ncbi:MAG: hypothetical protein COA67_06510 [Lutibacter sp.]|nr:MAG: hypothetical protein COA67_06510 [Lutibacter sp.]